MASKRTDFARSAEIRRCESLINHYMLRGWTQRMVRVRKHIHRLEADTDRTPGFIPVPRQLWRRPT